jgi:hypothetical protein
MSNRLSTILPDIKDPDFILDYELGVWVAIFGEEMDIDFAGSWFQHIGFCLGVLHGGILSANPFKLVKLAAKINPDFSEDYYVDMNENWLLSRYLEWLHNLPLHRFVVFELIMWICNRMLDLTYRILLELAPEAVTDIIE